MTPLLTEVLRKAPPAPPIKRQRVDDKRSLNKETQALLIKVHVRHGKWIRTHFVCAFAGLTGKTPLGKEIVHECQGRIESHHVETRGAGGGDEQQIPLCHLGHTQHHNGYWFPLDQEQMAAELWKADTYHRQKYEREQLQQTPRSGVLHTRSKT